MTVQLDISFETLVELVRQLPADQQQQLLHRIQAQTYTNGQNVAEKMRKLRSAQIDARVNQVPSPRREEWYDDNGR